MSMRSAHRGAQLPYQLLAGVLPTNRGWLVASAKLQGITLSPEQPQTFSSFIDILDYKPAFQVIALFSPVGLADQPKPRGRICEQEARKLLGWPRSSAIASAPARSALGSTSYEEAVAANGGHLNPVVWSHLGVISEVDKQMAPYWQRTVYEVHPELSFYQLSEDQPLRFSKHLEAGRNERRQILTKRFPGVDRIIDTNLRGISQSQLLDVAACLWTARRIVAKAVMRLPEFPEWDSLGLRMEIVR